jgi:hypothetical protein
MYQRSVEENFIQRLMLAILREKAIYNCSTTDSKKCKKIYTPVCKNYEYVDIEINKIEELINSSNDLYLSLINSHTLITNYSCFMKYYNIKSLIVNILINISDI